MIPKRYNKFDIVKRLTLSRKQWYKNFENPSNFIFIVHLLVLRSSARRASPLTIDNLITVIDDLLLVNESAPCIQILLKFSFGLILPGQNVDIYSGSMCCTTDNVHK